MVPSFSSGPIANCVFTRRAQLQIHGSRIATAQSRTSKFTTRTHEPALHSRTVRSLLRSHHASRMIHLFPSLALCTHQPQHPTNRELQRCAGGATAPFRTKEARGEGYKATSEAVHVSSFLAPPLFFPFFPLHSFSGARFGACAFSASGPTGVR